MTQPVCVFTSVCDADARWFDQYLAEMRRLGLPFVVHFDRCGAGTVKKFAGQALFRGFTARTDPTVEFNEQHKQDAHDTVARLGYYWAMAWDLDETFPTAGPGTIEAALAALQTGTTSASTGWINLWGDTDHVRVDGPFALKPRVKFYNLRAGVWKYRSQVVNGPTLFLTETLRLHDEAVPTDFVCLHHGLMTRELREEHKARWDRIYGAATGGENPYKFWAYALDEETYPPTVVPNPYVVK